ncbi:MAG: hypothetical protein FD180_4349 [Planctomycetota bacterium]|nr:MAG: hypothetical protein FD180_4349 [Planctomycetota bacterium]
MKDKRKAMLDRLAELLKGTEPERLRSVLAKDATIIFRVSESDKASMAETATALGLTVTDYLTRLHLFAVEVLAKGRNGGKRE